MSDHHHHHRAAENEAPVSARPRRAVFDHRPSVALYLAVGPPDLKLRVLGAMVLLVVAKFATIAVPFTFKYATDALTGESAARRSRAG